MAVCPNCGAGNIDGAKFCGGCGRPLTVSGPVQPQPQPVQNVYQQPAAQPVQPVYQQIPTVYQQHVQVVDPQPVKRTAKKKANGLCVAGFVLSLCGLICLGLTCPLGFLLALIGLIVAIAKKKKGKGLAIAGLIISALIMSAVGVFIVNYKNDLSSLKGLSNAFSSNDSVSDPEQSDYAKLIEGNNWIAFTDQSYIVFDKKDKSFKYYQTYLDKTDNYYSGKYQIYYGEEAFEYITEDLSSSGITKDELQSLIDNNYDYETNNLICICLDHDSLMVDGVRQEREPWTIHYYGFYLMPKQDDKTFNVLDMANIEAGTYISFISEKGFADYDFEYSDPYHLNQVTHTASSDNEEEYEVMGNSITGTVTLLQGTWEEYTEDGLDEDRYVAFEARQNRDTESTISLFVYPEEYDSENNDGDYGDFVDSFLDVLDEDGYTDVTVEETVFGGYEATRIYGNTYYDMLFSAWFFYDGEGRLHIVTIDYYEYDEASYEMVRDTFSL